MRIRIVQIAALIIVLGAVAGAGYLASSNMFGLLPHSLQDDANRIVADCAGSPDTSACYDIEIPRLMNNGYTMEQAFQVAADIQSKTDGYFFCHVLGHELAGKETAKDPSKWTEVIARCPTNMCSYGCLHGAAAVRFRSESLPPEQVIAAIPQIATICEAGLPNATELERASCYHALGHLSMYMSDANVPTSLKVCDTVVSMNKRTDWKQICDGGVFMQIFQPLEPDDVALVSKIAPKTPADAESYCKTFAAPISDYCHNETWPLYIQALKTPGGVGEFCARMSDSQQENICYNNILYILVGQFDYKAEPLKTICDAVPAAHRGQCFGNVASPFEQLDPRLMPQAVSICKAAEAEGVGERCYKELLFFSVYSYPMGSDNFEKVCNALPEPWKTKCLNGEGKDLPFNTEEL